MTIQEKINYLKALAELLEKIDSEIKYACSWDGERYIEPTEEDFRYGEFMAWKTLYAKTEKLLMI